MHLENSSDGEVIQLQLINWFAEVEEWDVDLCCCSCSGLGQPSEFGSSNSLLIIDSELVCVREYGLSCRGGHWFSHEVS